MLILFAVPVLGVLLGGIYSIPAMKITNERDPWLTLLLVLGLGCTVFGIGFLGGTPFIWSLAVFALGIILALLARWLHGSLGHNLERFGMVHMLVLMLALGLAAVARHKKEEPNKPAHPTATSFQFEFGLSARRRMA